MNENMYWKKQQKLACDVIQNDKNTPSFTAEDPLVSKWLNATFLQICSDEYTNTKCVKTHRFSEKL